MLVLGAVSSCAAQKNKGLSALPQDIRAQVEAALSSVRIDDTDKERIVDAIGEDPSRFALLFREVRDVMKKDPDLLRRVDKTVALPADFVPDDLVPLDGPFPYVVSKKGMLLRAPARDALVRMAEAARKEGKTLVVSSAYRSYEYQKLYSNGTSTRWEGPKPSAYLRRRADLNTSLGRPSISALSQTTSPKPRPANGSL